MVDSVLCSVSDVFSHGAWLDIESMEDPELKDLATALPSIVMQGKAPATVKNTLVHLLDGKGGLLVVRVFLSYQQSLYMLLFT